MRDSMDEYMETYYSWFKFVLLLYICHDTNKNKIIVDDCLYEYEHERKYIWAVVGIILNLSRVLEEVPELGPYVLKKANFYPPGKARIAVEEDYRNWMHDLLNQFKERMVEYQSRSVDKEDVYFEKHYPAFRNLLVWLMSFGEDEASRIDKIFYVHQKDPESIKRMVVDLKEVLKMDAFPWEYAERILRRGGDKAEYRKWMEDVLRELEMRIGG